jgi:MFS transporter, SP family, sugar:H+ symporter
MQMPPDLPRVLGQIENAWYSHQLFVSEASSMGMISLKGGVSLIVSLDYGLTGAFMAMVGFLKVFGYEAPASPIGWNISTTVQQLITSLMVVGGILGSLLQGPLSSYLGRRRSIQLASIICIVSSAIMISTTSVGALYVGRIILGISNGIFITTAQMYIVEVLPANLRGVGLGILV